MKSMANATKGFSRRAIIYLLIILIDILFVAIAFSRYAAMVEQTGRLFNIPYLTIIVIFLCAFCTCVVSFVVTVRPHLEYSLVPLAALSKSIVLALWLGIQVLFAVVWGEVDMMGMFMTALLLLLWIPYAISSWRAKISFLQ